MRLVGIELCGTSSGTMIFDTFFVRVNEGIYGFVRKVVRFTNHSRL